MPRNQYITVRQSTAATWTSVNPILARGEIGYETDTGKFKVGTDGSTTWNSLGYGGLSSFQNTSVIENFGDGSDGNLTLTAANYTGGPVVAGALTRDAYFNNLTINGTGSLDTNNYRLFVAGTLDISAAATGAVNNNGFSGNNANQPNGGAAPTTQLPTGSVGGSGVGTAGGNGGAMNGNNATSAVVSASPSNGGSGGNGANGTVGPSGGTAGTGGNGGSGGTAFPINRFETELLKGITVIIGGAGGAGGGGSGGNYYEAGGGAGGGGNGGGILAVYANTIARGTNTNPGIFQANGGNGGNGSAYASTGAGGAGGGGGGGGWAFICYGNLTGSTIVNGVQANGGSGGSGGTAYQYGTAFWINREKLNGSSSWSTTLVYDYGGGVFSTGQTICIDSSGNIYNGGFPVAPNSGNEPWLVRKSSDGGVTWSIVDTYFYPGTTANSSPTNTVIDIYGNIYIGGYSFTQPFFTAAHSIVRQSKDNGVTWNTTDDFTFSGSTFCSGTARDTLGNTYSIGSGNNSGLNEWFVRETSDQGATWNTVDNYQLVVGQTAAGSGIAGDALGNVYAIGNGNDATGVSHSIIRMSSNGGSTWTTVDNYQYPGSGYPLGAPTQGINVGIDASNNVYAVISGNNASASDVHWVIRRSTNQGVTWTTVDDFIYTANNLSNPKITVADSNGNIYVAGSARDSTGTQHWIVRESSDGGNTWITSDDFIYQDVAGNLPPLNPQQVCVARSMAPDAFGNVFTTGYASGQNETNGNGGNGANGGNGGRIFLLNIPTSVSTFVVGSAGSSGSAGSGINGGNGGAGGLAQVNL